MKPTPITVEEVIQFAREHADKTLRTLADRKPFTIRPDESGIRYELPSGKHWPIRHDRIVNYLTLYHESPPERRTKTTIFPANLRERSYMTSILFELQTKRGHSDQSPRDGLNDLDDAPEGNDCPDRAKTSSYRVDRDANVRAYVLKLAGGKCEFCGKTGFLTIGGLHYLETHHVIALAKEGRDTVDNVIALCPEHHREAHYGKASKSLEQTFLICINNRKR